MPEQRENRVVVCGGGIAGLTAGVTALQCGVPVTLFEKAPELGGNAAISGGVLWSFLDYDRIRKEVPDGDPVLQWLVFENVDEASRWLSDQGARLSESVEQQALGRRERRMEPAQAIAALADKFTALGGELRVETALEALLESDGVIGGVRTACNGRTRDEPARAVVLATGGFQGNAELISRYVVRDTDSLYLRASPWSTGDGFVAATQAGAAASPGLDTFYGHALAAPPARFSKFNFRDVTQWYGQQSIAVNLLGERFADESDGNSEHVLNQRLAQQPQGRGFYIIDQETAESPAICGKELLTRTVLERARAAGAPIVVADTLELLCRGLASYGVPAQRLMQEIVQFNAAIERGDAGELKPPRARNRRSLRRPPFYAVGVKASITFTMGGVQVDEHARVLRRAGGTSQLAQVAATRGLLESEAQVVTLGTDYRQSAIEGLYAAGSDVGNICHFGYLGGLGPALVTGRLAGQGAAGLNRNHIRQLHR
jgi:succinate dehydrogenase/fumarate reductase flavoprotein subunit